MSTMWGQGHSWVEIAEQAFQVYGLKPRRTILYIRAAQSRAKRTLADPAGTKAHLVGVLLDTIKTASSSQIRLDAIQGLRELLDLKFRSPMSPDEIKLHLALQALQQQNLSLHGQCQT